MTFTLKQLIERVDPDLGQGGDSVDAELDRLLSTFVQDAKSKQLESRSRIKESEQARRFEKPADGKQKGIEQVDVARLAQSMQRLIESPEDLLDLRGLVLRRCVSFIAQRYDEPTVESLKRQLGSRGIDINDVHGNNADLEHPAPRADRAGPGGGLCPVTLRLRFQKETRFLALRFLLLAISRPESVSYNTTILRFKRRYFSSCMNFQSDPHLQLILSKGLTKRLLLKRYLNRNSRLKI